jgi:hypothetical protein
MSIEVYLIWREGKDFSGLQCCDIYRNKELAKEAARELQQLDPRFKFFPVPARLHD